MIVLLRRGILTLLVVLSGVAGCGPAESTEGAMLSASQPTPAGFTALPREVATAPVPGPSTASEAPIATPTAPPESTSLARESTLELYSDHVADWYKVYVGLPKGYNPQHSRGYPVIYLLDADWYFDRSSMRIGDGGVARIVASLGESGRIPKSIVVGIGYVKSNQRGRDLLWAPEKFYAFMAEELIPFVDGEYRTDTSAPRTLVGHSDGGYFALYALFQSGGTSDPPFEQFIAISGDLTKNEWLPFREEGKMNRRVGEGGAVGGALFLAVGGKEESRFVTSTQDMARRLDSRKYLDFRFKSRVFRSDDHMSVVTPAVWSGLLWVFGKQE